MFLCLIHYVQYKFPQLIFKIIIKKKVNMNYKCVNNNTIFIYCICAFTYEFLILANITKEKSLFSIIFFLFYEYEKKNVTF